VRPNVPAIVVFITDGKPWVHSIRDNDSFKSNRTEVEKEATENAANSLISSGIYNQTLAIGIENKRGNLGDTLGLISNMIFRVSGFDDELFNELAQNVTNEFCSRK